MCGEWFFCSQKHGWQGLEFPTASLMISCIASFWKLFIMWCTGQCRCNLSLSLGLQRGGVVGFM